MGAPKVPRKPDASHKKDISTVSVRTIGREGDYEERERAREPAGRRKLQPLKTDFGRSKRSVELIPKPSDNSKDPLNWPRWKKETTFCTILLSTAVVSMLKVAFVTTNSVIASEFNSSYMATAAFTGFPYMFAALSNLGSSVLSQVIGKRAMMIASGFLMLAGALWNMHVESYAPFMISRLFQGIGWGAAEGLAVVSIRDIYFVHERGIRFNIHNITSLIFTWGSPILGGYLSQSSEGFREVLMVITIIQAFSVLFLIVLLPETTYVRAAYPLGSTSEISATPTAMKAYLSTLHPAPHRASFSLESALKPIRALGTPTALLTLLATFPLVPASQAFANSLSLLFGGMPTFVFPTRLGYIFILPLVFAIFAYTIVSLVSRFRSPTSALTSTFPMSQVIPAMLLGVSGLIAFGLYTIGQLGPQTLTNSVTVFADPTGSSLSLRVISALFGMLVAGSVMLSYTADQHISAASSSSPGDSDRALEIGHKFWESIWTGVFIIAVPAWIQMSGGGNVGLRDVAVAFGVVQIMLGSTAGAVMVMKKAKVESLDEKIMGVRKPVGGSSQLKGWNSQESFFDA